MVKSLAITNKIDTKLLRNKIDSVDKHAKEKDDDDDHDILVPEKETESEQIEIKLNNVISICL